MSPDTDMVGNGVKTGATVQIFYIFIDILSSYPTIFERAMLKSLARMGFIYLSLVLSIFCCIHFEFLLLDV